MSISVHFVLPFQLLYLGKLQNDPGNVFILFLSGRTILESCRKFGMLHLAGINGSLGQM
jgi:hypothetical protein